MGYSCRFRKREEGMLSKNSLKTILQCSGISIAKSLLWDERYYYFSLVDWGKAFKDVLFNLPRYTVDKFDCDNMAMLTAVRVQERYKVNGCGIAIGDSPWGYHAWNIFLADGRELFYLEPQDGMIYEIDNDDGYKAHYVVWG